MLEAKNVLFYIRNIKNYVLLISVTLISVIIFKFTSFFEPHFNTIIKIASYLTWHNVFEFVAVFVSFSIFVLQFSTYDQTKRMRSLFLSCIFLCTGILETLHTLSFKGMPGFFVENISSNRATTYWIILSIFSSLGLMIGSIIPKSKEIKCNKSVFLLISLLICFGIFVIVTYYPDLLPQMYIEGKGLTPAKIFLEKIISGIFTATAIILIMDYIKSRDYHIQIFACGVILRVFASYGFIKYQKVDDFYNYLGHLFLCVSYFLIFRVAFLYNIKEPYLKLAKAEKELKEHAENLDRMVHERTVEYKKLYHSLLTDLEYARDIQWAMLPEKLPDTEKIGFYAQYFPVDSVGGDFYNIINLDSNKYAMYIGDVSGHGVSAAMLTVFINQCIAATRENDENDLEIIMPSMVLKRVYEEFNRINFKDDVYLVMLYAIFDTQSMELTFSSAGMNVSPLIIENDGNVKEMEIHGFPICKFSEYYSANYVDSSMKLVKGSKILFYTDGVTESQCEKDIRFSEEKLKEIAGSNSSYSGTALGEIITNEIFNFIDMSKLKDDITFFIMEAKS